MAGQQFDTKKIYSATKRIGNVQFSLIVSVDNELKKITECPEEAELYGRFLHFVEIAGRAMLIPALEQKLIDINMVEREKRDKGRGTGDASPVPGGTVVTP